MEVGFPASLSLVPTELGVTLAIQFYASQSLVIGAEGLLPWPIMQLNVYGTYSTNSSISVIVRCGWIISQVLLTECDWCRSLWENVIGGHQTEQEQHWYSSAYNKSGCNYSRYFKTNIKNPGSTKSHISMLVFQFKLSSNFLLIFLNLCFIYVYH